MVAASLVSSVMVLINDVAGKGAGIEITLAVYLPLLGYLAYRLLGLSYQTFRGQIWFLSIALLTTALPFIMMAYDDTTLSNFFGRHALVSVSFTWILVMHLLLFIGYLKQKHLPMKK
ncbi:MAG: hypothetical protein AAGJ93_16020 [Bacteroidota bacterium]